MSCLVIERINRVDDEHVSLQQSPREHQLSSIHLPIAILGEQNAGRFSLKFAQKIVGLSKGRAAIAISLSGNCPLLREFTLF